MVTAGKYMYLAGLTELAIYNFFKGDFAMTRPPALPEWLKGINPVMAYVAGILLLLCIALVIWNKYTSQALITIAAIIFLCATTRHVFAVWKDPINGFKTLWLIGAALLILSEVEYYRKYQRHILFANVIVLFMFFYHCAVAHFQYAASIQYLIPSYIPFRLFFTWLAGICLLFAGIGLLTSKFQQPAALLSGIQITGWFLLLHLPRAFTMGGDEWIGVGESLAVAGICFMLYGMFRRAHPIA
ncbi:hypothetical protein A3860_22485 [Niastella vici]|uniref:DoxX family protein n=1 Tax=Niastella vici TaxID=1703345 RepID=A0A1V9G128_9BACT|nr:hypothetical protein [Niastella vici]OQP64176.1 hypothetical protein A3860_22485 [Niastella vici]